MAADQVEADRISVRAAADGNRRALALLFAAVAQERDGIAAEPPVDVDELAKSWNISPLSPASQPGRLRRLGPPRF